MSVRMTQDGAAEWGAAESKKTARHAVDMRRAFCSLVAPIAGMTFFWAYLRYQNFFMALYPLDASIALGPVRVPDHLMFIAMFVPLSLIGLIAWRPIATWAKRHRLAATLCACVGSVGAAFALAVRMGVLSAPWIWASIPLVVLGYLSALLMWGSYLSRGFDKRKLFIAVFSYFLGLLLFNNVFAVAHGDGFWLTVTALIPLGAGAFWFVSGMADAGIDGCSDRSSGNVRDEVEEKSNIGELASPSIWLFVAFLLAGGMVRGVIDAGVPVPSVRHQLSIPITALFVVACLVHGARRTSRGETSFVLRCWVAFSLLFFYWCVRILGIGRRGRGRELGGDRALDA